MGSGYPRCIIPVPLGDKHGTNDTISDSSTTAAAIVVTYSICVATLVELHQIHQPEGILLEPRIIVNNFGALGFREGTASFAVGAFALSNIAALRVLALDATHQLAFASAMAAVAVTSFVANKASSVHQLPHLPSKATH